MSISKEVKMVNSEKIRQLMSEKGITAKEMSERVGVTEMMMSYIKNGLRSPSVEVLVRIANVLGCKVDDLIIEK